MGEWHVLNMFVLQAVKCMVINQTSMVRKITLGRREESGERRGVEERDVKRTLGMDYHKISKLWIIASRGSKNSDLETGNIIWKLEMDCNL